MLQEMAMLASKDFTAAKKDTSSGARPDNHWRLKTYLSEPTWHMLGWGSLS